MKANSLIALSALTLAIGSAFAADPGDTTRDQVRQSIIAARAAGQLHAAGPAYDGPAPYAKNTSTLSRGTVKHEVAVARADGELKPAGEAGDGDYDPPVASTSTLSRATVKAETIEARADGELIPAGEGELPRAERTHASYTASSGKPSFFSSLFHIGK